MAHPYYNPKVGDFIYPAYAPQKAGVIVEYTPNTNPFAGNIKIKMANGNVLAHPERNLQDFNALKTINKSSLAGHKAAVTKGQMLACDQSV